MGPTPTGLVGLDDEPTLDQFGIQAGAGGLVEIGVILPLAENLPIRPLREFVLLSHLSPFHLSHGCNGSTLDGQQQVTSVTMRTPFSYTITESAPDQGICPERPLKRVLTADRHRGHLRPILAPSARHTARIQTGNKIKPLVDDPFSRQKKV